DKAQEAAHMQSLLHQWEQACHDLQQLEQRCDSCKQALDAFDAQWLTSCTAVGLAGLPLEQAPEWLARKDRALEAEQALVHAGHDVAQLRATQQATRDSLARALVDSGALDAQAAQAQTLDG